MEIKLSVNKSSNFNMNVLSIQDVEMINRILETALEKNVIMLRTAVEICGNDKSKALEFLNMICDDGYLKTNKNFNDRWFMNPKTEEALIIHRYEKLRLQQIEEKEIQDINKELAVLSTTKLKHDLRKARIAYIISIIAIIVAVGSPAVQVLEYCQDY